MFRLIVVNNSRAPQRIAFVRTLLWSHARTLRTDRHDGVAWVDDHVALTDDLPDLIPRGMPGWTPLQLTSFDS
jgi:hypothetical protein